MNINHATKKTATSFCILSGFASIIHGFFEILQGNVPVKIGKILAIGPAHRLWEFGGEPALTIIPNYLITGILAIIISICLFVWAFIFIDKKHNLLWIVLLTISILLFGGGLAPPTFMIISIVAILFIKQDLVFRISSFMGKILNYFSFLWPGILYFQYVLFLIAIISGVSGYPFLWVFDAGNSIKYLRIYGLIVTFVMGPLTIISAIANDAKKI